MTTRRPPSALAAFAFAALVAASFAPSRALAAGELVQNGLLTSGREDKPDHWLHEGYTEGPATQYGWTVDDAGVGTITIASSQPNDARWVQNVPVSPSTWYSISAWVRAENVGTQMMGAYLSVMDTFHNTRDLRGTSGWQPLAMWVKTGAIETSLRIACRLGGYSSLNTGTASCTGISVQAAGTPQPGTAFTYGGTPGESGGKGLPIAQGVAVLLVIGILLLLWRYLAPPSARIPP